MKLLGLRGSHNQRSKAMNEEINELTLEIVRKTQEGIRMFGDYNYHDKGAREVMDINGITTKLIELGDFEVAAKVLLDVEEILIKNSIDPQPLLMDIVGSMDELPEADFDTLVNANDGRLQDYY